MLQFQHIPCEGTALLAHLLSIASTIFPVVDPLDASLGSLEEPNSQANSQLYWPLIGLGNLNDPPTKNSLLQIHHKLILDGKIVKASTFSFAA